MEFITKKTKDNPNGIINDKELLKILHIQEVYNKIEELSLHIEEIKNKKISVDDILKGLKKSMIELNCPINIKSAVSIEKNKKITEGTIYYNKAKGLRLKTETKWITILK